MKRLLSVEEAAEYLGIGHRTLYNRTCRRATRPFPVRPKHIGHRVLFDVKELDAYVDSLPREGYERARKDEIHED